MIYIDESELRSSAPDQIALLSLVEVYRIKPDVLVDPPGFYQFGGKRSIFVCGVMRTREKTVRKRLLRLFALRSSLSLSLSCL